MTAENYANMVQNRKYNHREKLLKVLYWAYIAIILLFVGLYIWFVFYYLNRKNDNFAYKTTTSIVGSFIHIISGHIIWLGGAFQFSTTVRNKYPKFHRLSGYAYLISQIVSVVGIILVLTKPESGVIGGTAGVIFTIYWLFTAYMGYAYIKNRNIQLHREWMLRNYVLTLSIIAMRPIAMIITSTSGRSLSDSVGISLWMGWVICSAAVEIYIRQHYYGGWFETSAHVNNRMFTSLIPANPKLAPSTATSFSTSVTYKGLIFAQFTNFTRVVLTQRIRVAKDVDVFTFQLPLPNMVLGPIPPGCHVLIRSADGVTRPYTPINTADSPHGVVEILIKKYAFGQVSNFAHSLKVGDAVEICGPVGTSLEVPTSGKIGLIAGGTGITPIYKLLMTIFENPYNTAQVNLLYRNSSVSSILLKPALDNLAQAYPERLTITYSLSSLSARASDPNYTGEKEEGKEGKEAIEEEEIVKVVEGAKDRQAKGTVNYESGVIDQQVLLQEFPEAAFSQIFLCGPPAMNIRLTELLLQNKWKNENIFGFGTSDH